ncbi:DUF7550 family protein [Salarchaeum japonicum]|uniref:Uncharacterized protein n=1 Tax=Salarchaeum japonicum TaxID=555573 RepID=A0AAV3T2N2_9EURY|nr:hypothetical protein [Salarchaeum japonicum]
MSDTTDTDEPADEQDGASRHDSRVTSPMQAYGGRAVLTGFLVLLLGLAVVVAPALLV